MQIRAKAVQVDAKGKPKTKATRVGLSEWTPKLEDQAA